MKTVIVKSSVIEANKLRLDAGFYIGEYHETAGDADVAKATTAARRAADRLRRARRSQRRAAERRQKMIDTGEIVPVEGEQS